MNAIDKRLQKYYETGNYKGFFLKGSDRHYKFFGMTHITFTNGEKEFFASGIFREEAYVKMFDLIDEYLLKE